MFSRSSRTRKRVSQPATVSIIKPAEEQKETIDLSKATVKIIKPKKGLKILVDKADEGEDE